MLRKMRIAALNIDTDAERRDELLRHIADFIRADEARTCARAVVSFR